MLLLLRLQQAKMFPARWRRRTMRLLATQQRSLSWEDRRLHVVRLFHSTHSLSFSVRRLQGATYWLYFLQCLRVCHARIPRWDEVHHRMLPHSSSSTTTSV